MKCRIAFGILCLGLIAISGGCRKKQVAVEPARTDSQSDASRDTHADEAASMKAAVAPEESPYEGERAPFEGVWFNREILRAYQETNSPNIAAGNGVISDIAFTRDSAMVTWFSYWGRSCTFRFKARDWMVLVSEFEIAGTIRFHDSGMTYQRDGDTVVNHLVRISDSATLNSSEVLNRLILKPPLIGTYQGDSDKTLRIGLDRIEGFRKCSGWSVSLSYLSGYQSFDLSMAYMSYPFDKIVCFREGDSEQEVIAYQLLADSLLIFDLEDEFHIADTAGRFARNPR